MRGKVVLLWEAQVVQGRRRVTRRPRGSEPDGEAGRRVFPGNASFWGMERARDSSKGGRRQRVFWARVRCMAKVADIFPMRLDFQVVEATPMEGRSLKARRGPLVMRSSDSREAELVSETWARSGEATSTERVEEDQMSRDLN